MEGGIIAQTSCVILSAGNSVRMGTNKALLKFNAQNTFIQQITETYVLSGIEQIIVVVNGELFDLIKKSQIKLSPKVLLVINKSPELGRFYSLKTGIQHINQENFCFFQNIDNPYTSIEIIISLSNQKNKAEVIIPVFKQKAGHPVLINPLVTNKIRISTTTEIRIDEFLKQFDIKNIQSNDDCILSNINSPQDYLGAGFEI
jgi:molybdenum cofactor cytidylyltransferase